VPVDQRLLNDAASWLRRIISLPRAFRPGKAAARFSLAAPAGFRWSCEDDLVFAGRLTKKEMSTSASSRGAAQPAGCAS